MPKIVADKKMAGAGVAISYGDAPVAYLAAGAIAFDRRSDSTKRHLPHLLDDQPVTGVAAMLLIEDGKRCSISRWLTSCPSSGAGASRSTSSRAWILIRRRKRWRCGIF